MSHSDSPQERLHQQNDALVKDFGAFLKTQGLDRDVMEGHEFNLEFYLNHYLLHGGMKEPEAGVAPELVRDFLGNYFVHKAMWTDVAEQKASIRTLVLFYNWLKDLGRVSTTAVQELCDMIACEQEDWFASMERCSEASLETWQAVDDSDLIEDELYFNIDDESLEDTSDFFLDIEDIGIPLPDDSGLEALDDVPELEEQQEEDLEDDKDKRPGPSKS